MIEAKPIEYYHDIIRSMTNEEAFELEADKMKDQLEAFKRGKELNDWTLWKILTAK